MNQAKVFGFFSVIGLWVVLTCLCYEGVIVFDNTTLGGAMLSSLILSSSILSIVRLLKMIYDGIYSTLTEDST